MSKFTTPWHPKNELHLSLTGHRPNNLGGYNINTPEYDYLQFFLEKQILSYTKPGLTIWGHSGLALGADTVWSKAILHLKELYPDNIRFQAEVPFIKQADRWPYQADKDFWQYQIDHADKVSYYNQDADLHKKSIASNAYFRRNKGLVNHCDILIALSNPDVVRSGTQFTIDYAKNQKRQVIEIDSRHFFGKKTN